MWSDESRLTLFQSDGSVREEQEVMLPSCTVPTVHASGGSVRIWRGGLQWVRLRLSNVR